MKKEILYSLAQIEVEILFASQGLYRQAGYSKKIGTDSWKPMLSIALKLMLQSIKNLKNHF